MPTGYIYEIKSTDTAVTETYIGSTWDMATRLITHVSNCYNKKQVDYNYPVYRYIRENGDFHTFNMRVIDSGECEDVTELVCGEQFYIDMAGGIDNLLNGKDAFLLPEEYKKKQCISAKKKQRKNVETKRFPCNLCGFYFVSNFKLQKHLAGPNHTKKLASENNTENP
tara:strand:+ start:189 stop:692 length:504 start_codon:yes stop_codon:yes gene_type:complete